MGAWGIGAFENDDALDWVWSLDGDDADELLADTLHAAAKGRDVDSTVGANAIAAATILAAALDGQRAELPPEAVAYLERRSASPDPKLLRQAVTALDRVTADGSELAELWDDSDDGPEWRESLAATRRRLVSADR